MSETAIGPVALTVSDLDRMVDFYREVIGFRLHRREGDSATLGAGRADLLVLAARPGARRTPGTTGLYHFAVLMPSRLALARSLKRLAETRTPVQGFADHLVSEAIYLADPEDNGIELYRDRPRSNWLYIKDQLLMGTEPLDVEGVLAELEGQDTAWDGLHPDTIIGHIHLHVADLDQAESFYRDLLGLEVMVRIMSASFLAFGGYHHHLGINTWVGQGAPSPPPDALGLHHYALTLPDAVALDAALARLEAAGVAVGPEDGGYLVRDPSQNAVLLRTN